MIVGSIARRYARALFDLAVEKNEVENWANALAQLQQLVAASPELRDVLENPVYTRDQRRAVGGKLAAVVGLPEEPANLLYLLGDRNRLSYLQAIADNFARLADGRLGRVRAKLISAVPLDAAAEGRIASRFAQATNRQILLASEVDPALLGGIVAQVGALTYDGSLRTQLEALRQQLKQ